MSDSRPDLNFDLKLTPDWLKEETPRKFANYEGERDGRGDRDGRPDDRRRDSRRTNRPPQNKRDSSEPRSHKPGDRRPQNPRHQSAPGSPLAKGAPQRSMPNRDPIPLPSHLKVELLPEPRAAENIAAQIKSSHRSYPLFMIAKLFLEKPERHHFLIISTDPKSPLYRCGDIVSLESAAAEKTAFSALRDEFYIEEKMQGEPPKGNFTNVARCRLNGALLGPTSHHTYQTGLRQIYEKEFSRRMAFHDFLRSIETVADPELVEAWKQQVSSVVLFKTVKETEPLTFSTEQEMEAHFRANYLAAALANGERFEISGPAGRNLPNQILSKAIRTAWEKEETYPAQISHALCHSFTNAGLHIFRHHKRYLYASVIRPEPLRPDNSGVRPQVTEILQIITTHPRCTRADLGAKLLGGQSEDAEQLAKHKTELAADLHFLIHAGHVIEFHDGKLGLPFSPKAKMGKIEKQEKREKKSAQKKPVSANPANREVAENSANRETNAPASAGNEAAMKSGDSADSADSANSANNEVAQNSVERETVVLANDEPAKSIEPKEAVEKTDQPTPAVEKKSAVPESGEAPVETKSADSEKDRG